MPPFNDFRSQENRQNTPSHNLYASLSAIFELWHEGTEVSRKLRSSKLKHIDNSFAAYIRQPAETNLMNLKTALTLWKQAKGLGNAWKLNPRNATNIIGTLDELLFGWRKGQLLTRQTLLANLAKQGRQRVLADIVRGRRVEFKQGTAGKIKEKLKEEVGKGVREAKTTAKRKYYDKRGIHKWESGRAGGGDRSGIAMGGQRNTWQSATPRGGNPTPAAFGGGHRAGRNRGREGAWNLLVEGAKDTAIGAYGIGMNERKLATGIMKDLEADAAADAAAQAARHASATEIKETLINLIESANLDQVALAISAKLGNTKFARIVASLQTGIFDILSETLKEYAPEVVEEVVDFLVSAMPDFLGELTEAMLPYVGVATSGFSMAKNFAEASKSAYDIVKGKQHARFLGSGSPEAAGNALIGILEEELTYNSAMFGINSAAFTAKLAGNIADAVSFGAPTVSVIVTPTAGLTACLLQLSAQIGTLAREIYRKQEGNRLIQSGRFDPAELFDKCPVLGCYFIVSASGMNLYEMIPREMMRPEWECIRSVISKQHHFPLMEKAADLLASSRLCVTGGTGNLRANELADWAGTHGIANIPGKVKSKIEKKIGL